MAAEMKAMDSEIMPPIEKANMSYVRTKGEVTRILARSFCALEKDMHTVFATTPMKMNTEYHASHVSIPITACMTANIMGIVMLLLPFRAR